MSLYEFVSLVLTFGTLLVIYLTLFELKNQREAIYKPDLVLRSTGRFYIYNERNGRFGFLPSLWVDENVAKSKIFSKNESLEEYEKLKMPDDDTFQELSKDPNRNKIGIPIFNIGKGVAKNIEFTWEFDQEYHKELMEKNKQMNIWKKYEFTSNFIPSPDIYPSSTKKIDYITPTETGSPKEITEKVYIPYLYQICFNQDITLELNIHSITHLPILNISYEDLANQRHYKKFIINFDSGYGSLTHSNKGIQKNIVYHLEVKYQISQIK